MCWKIDHAHVEVLLSLQITCHLSLIHQLRLHAHGLDVGWNTTDACLSACILIVEAQSNEISILSRNSVLLIGENSLHFGMVYQLFSFLFWDACGDPLLVTLSLVHFGQG